MCGCTNKSPNPIPIPIPEPTPTPTPGAAPVFMIQPGDCVEVGPVTICAVGSPSGQVSRLRPQNPKEKPGRPQLD